MGLSPSLFSSDKDDWQTPPEIFGPLHDEFDFTIDAAATAANAMRPRYWTVEDDAISQDWVGERIWCNPPYGRTQKSFIEKAAECRAEVAVLLLPAHPDTAAWHDWIFPVAEVRFLRGRIKFVGGQHSAPFPSAVAIFRRKEEQDA